MIDTNVFVAAGFNPYSHSARLVEAVRDGRLRIVWDDATNLVLSCDVCNRGLRGKASSLPSVLLLQDLDKRNGAEL